ncbi:MAG: hypothetical protein E7665_06830 [Ruminococcaceae bacterium]|nr:hypothetical protein [Oscillospiraceae bacterium]
MQKKNVYFKTRLAACSLALIAVASAITISYAASQNSTPLGAIRAAAAPASSGDPLVTLSYVNNVLKPQIEADMNVKVQEQVTTALAAGISQEMKDAILSYASAELLSAYEENLNKLSASVSEYETKISTLTTELENYKSEEFPKLEQSIKEEILKESENTKKELETLNTQAEAIKKELEAFKETQIQLNDFTKTSEEIKKDIAELTAKNEEITSKINDMTVKMENASALLKSATEAFSQLQGSGSVYEVVHLTKGQKLMAKSAVEIIHRAGLCHAISPFSDQGLADMTASVELYNGDALTKNNYCLIPRGNDGRGIEVDSDEVYIMIRGEYTIEE